MNVSRPGWLRAFVALAVLLSLAAGSLPRAVVALEDEETEVESDECRCATANACWHYLHAPVNGPDPCWCPRCEPGRQHVGNSPPKGWNPLCFASGSLDCFLRRHAASWRITCSECLANTKCCDFANSERCPGCGEGDRKDPFRTDCFGKDARTAVAARVVAEQGLFDKKKPVVLYSRHFYVVTDIERVQMRTQGGGRSVGAHEYAHVMLERAEKAYRTFSDAFRGRVVLLRPTAILLPQRENMGGAIREAYFKNRNAPMIYSAYAGTGESSIAQGFCLNGLCVSLGQAGGDDVRLHQIVRHLLGNILVTCWIRPSGDNKTIPRWAFEGAGHWLGRLPKDLRDEAWFCIGEASKVSGSGTGWMPELASTARKNGFAPMREFIDKSSLGRLTLEDHKRAWGIFEICMSEWRKPFVDMLAALRTETDQRDAFQEHLGCTPEQFHQRWVERLLGTRRPITAQQPDRPAVGAGPVTQADPPHEVASQIRALGRVTDPADVRKLVDLIGRVDGDLVRETAMESLRRLDDAACKRALWETGLAHSERFARAYTARLCRKLRLAEAKEPLRKLLDDPFWLARTEAALALATLRDYDSQAKVREMAGDASPKARIGAMDALALFGSDVNDLCVPVVAGNVGHPDWQVRVAACQVLRRIGDEQCIEALVGRMQVEAGRVGEEILRTLREISGEDLGVKPESWKKWWEREGGRVKERHGFDPKVRPGSDANRRYATPETPPQEYYGVQLFSQRIGFVIDTSRSTNRKFIVDASTRAFLHDDYPGATISQIIQGEAAASIEALDPRASFNVVQFGTEVRRWEKSMVPATEANRHRGAGFARGYSPDGETNFYGALATALDLDLAPIATPDFRDTPDTMVFLTDGTPTKGDITDGDTLLEWYTELNRYLRVRTHTIAFGQLEVDEDLLLELALRNEGQFQQIFETN